MVSVGRGGAATNNKKSEKCSPTILWEMAQSPYCGPAAIISATQSSSLLIRLKPVDASSGAAVGVQHFSTAGGLIVGEGGGQKSKINNLVSKGLLLGPCG